MLFSILTLHPSSSPFANLFQDQFMYLTIRGTILFQIVDLYVRNYPKWSLLLSLSQRVVLQVTK